MTETTETTTEIIDADSAEKRRIAGLPTVTTPTDMELRELGLEFIPNLDLAEVSRARTLRDIVAFRHMEEARTSISRFDKSNREPAFEYEKLVEDLGTTERNIARIQDAIEKDQATYGMLQESSEADAAAKDRKMIQIQNNRLVFSRQLERERTYSDELNIWIDKHIAWRTMQGMPV